MTDWPEGYGRIEFAEIDSTNEEARRIALSGAATPVWLRADVQTAGRGRRGRAWETPSGNLAATLLLRPERPVAECAQLSFVAAVAAAEAVGRYSDGVALKWPNDVLVHERKIAGLLLEASGAAAPSHLAIGIGINLAHHPHGTEFPATSLAAEGAAVPSPSAMLCDLAAAFATWYERWRSEGFAPVRSAWLSRAARLGAPIIARLAREDARGVFEGIDESGALMLRQGEELRILPAADVYFGA